MITDSGDRTQYETGAVRDMKAGKGRCDLIPLDIATSITKCSVIKLLSGYQITGGVECLYDILELVCIEGEWQMFPDTYTMLLEVAKHFEEGAKKYGEHNWEKGIPEWSYLDSATRHFLKWLRGDDDERHDRAFVWNIICLIWTHENIHQGEI